MLVDNAHGRLRLRRKVYALCNDFASVRKDTCFVTVHVSLSLFFGTEQKVKFRIFILEKQFQHFLAVIDFISFRICHSQCVIKGILCVCRIVFRVCIFLIKNFLNVRILCCHNFKTAAVQKVSCLGFCVPLNIHKVIDDLVCKLIFKVSIYFVAAV